MKTRLLLVVLAIVFTPILIIAGLIIYGELSPNQAELGLKPAIDTLNSHQTNFICDNGNKGELSIGNSRPWKSVYYQNIEAESVPIIDAELQDKGYQFIDSNPTNTSRADSVYTYEYDNTQIIMQIFSKTDLSPLCSQSYADTENTTYKPGKGKVLLWLQASVSSSD